MYTKAGPSGAGRVISKLVTFVAAVLTVSNIFRILLEETIANMYFLAPFYCSGYCLDISGNKNNSKEPT